MGKTLADLFTEFDAAYRDLLWVLLALIGGKPVSTKFGVVSQFIGVYREVLTKAGVVKPNGAVVPPDGENA